MRGNGSRRPAFPRPAWEPAPSTLRVGVLLFLSVLRAAPLALAEDWPTHRHDVRRSGVTAERLPLPLGELWRHTPRHAPRPAWPPPARRDFWHRLHGLSARVAFDRACHVAAVGDAVVFGSSATDKVSCLDAATGKLRWAFFAGGPVRLAPTLAEGRVYVGSDDGAVYCLDAADGKLLWRHKPAGGDRQVIGNGRIISAWPVRTGVLVADGVAHFCAGLFPSEGVTVHALDARDGSVRWTVKAAGFAPQGYLLASADKLYVPTGRTTPAVLARKDGRHLGGVKGTGGAFALLAGARLFHGPGRAGQLEVTSPNAPDRFLAFAGLRMVVTDTRAYAQTSTELTAIDHVRMLALVAESRKLGARQKAIAARLKKLGKSGGQEAKTLRAEHATNQATLRKLAADTKACTLWKQPCPHPFALILAGDTLLAGGDGAVAACATEDGKPLWTGKVDGRAYGLAVARGRLFVSTDKGTIHCFGQKRRLDTRAPTAAEVPAGRKPKQPASPQPLRLADGPYLRPRLPGAVLVEWRTEQPGACVVEYGAGASPAKRAPSDGSGTEHRALLTGLRAEDIQRFRIRWRGEPKAGRSAPAGVTRTYEFDATFASRPVVRPEGPAPFPDDGRRAAAVKSLIGRTGIRQGFCIVVGCADGGLPYELARQTDLTIVCIEERENTVAAARKALDKAGIYGTRVSVWQGSPAKLPFPSRFASLVVFNGAPVRDEAGAARSEMLRVLRPWGGAACFPELKRRRVPPPRLKLLSQWLATFQASAEVTIDKRGGDWIVARRGPMADAGQWTHMYADPGNTACSGDRRVAAPLEILWFGRPGPRLMIDRHHRTVPPLFRDGRLFIPGDDRIIAVDAWSGTVLWEVLIPGSHRAAAPKDTTYMALAADVLYVAVEDRCIALDVATGSRVGRFRVPGDKGLRHWGYVATVGRLLFGSTRHPGVSLRQEGVRTVNAQYGDLKEFTTSDGLFCLDRAAGRLLWSHRSGALLDTTIAIGGGRICFVESHALGDRPVGRTKLPALLEEKTFLVARSASDGRPLWRRPVDLSAVQHVLYLSHAEDTLLLLGSKNKNRRVWYELWAFDARTGQPLWHREQDNRQRQGGNHGEQVHHPVIVGDTVIAEPFAYHLRSGKPVDGWRFGRGGGGCGTLSASANHLFFRAGNPTMFDLRTRKLSKLTRVSRPGCWINILPVGGMVLIPEASSGCTCGYPIQTSFGLGPRSSQ